MKEEHILICNMQALLIVSSQIFQEADDFLSQSTGQT